MADDHLFPPQEQPYPGRSGSMDPQPEDEMRGYQGSRLLRGRRALITGRASSQEGWRAEAPR